MMTADDSRTTEFYSDILEWGVGVVRILIGTYFLAQAVSLWITPDPHMLFDFILAQEQSQLASVIFLSVASVGLLLNRGVKIALTMMAAHSIWSGIAFLDLSTGTGVLSSSWRDFTALAALALIALGRSAETQADTAGEPTLKSAPVQANA